MGRREDDRDETPAPPPAGRAGRRPGPWLLVAAGLTLVVSVALRLVDLRWVPGEPYGDIIVLLDYVGWILEGRWPTHMYQSAGPLYYYLAAPVLGFTGLTYLGAKVISVAVSLATLVATYGLARRLVDTRFAVTAAWVAGCSSWLLVFSRLGNSQILVPLVSTVSLWLAVRAAQRGSSGDVAGCAVVASLGLYVYPQSYILPAVAGLTLVVLRLGGHLIRRRHLALFTSLCVLLAIPFVASILRHPVELAGGGYIGSKLHSPRPAAVLAGNLARATLAFWVRGDGVSRSNPPGVPHVDPVSGVLLVAGLAFWLRSGRRRRLAAAVLLPFVLLQVPSVLVLSEPAEVPSASRTLGAAPFASILVASGLWWLATWRRHGGAPEPDSQAPRGETGPSRAGFVFMTVLLTVILALNVDRYFGRYARALPYDGTPVAALLADWADRLPPDTRVYLVDCCWAHGMPEPAAVAYSLASPERLVHLGTAGLRCSDLPLLDHPAVVVWDFRSPLPDPRLAGCADELDPEVARSGDDHPLFAFSPLLAPPLASLQARRPAAAAEGLVLERASFGGEAVALLHTPFDIGSAADVLDGQPATLARSATPGAVHLELHFPVPPTVGELVAQLGSVPGLHLVVAAQRPDRHSASTEVDLSGLPADPVVTVPLPTGRGPVAVVQVDLAIAGSSLERAQLLHIRDLGLR